MAGFLIKVSVEQDFQDLEGLLELGTGSGGGIIAQKVLRNKMHT